MVHLLTCCSFQEIIEYSALESSLRFLPHAITGVPVNIATGYLVSRVDVRILAVVAACITLIPAPLMATVTIGSNYWFAPFWALLLSPVSADGNPPILTSKIEPLNLLLKKIRTRLTAFSPLHRLKPRHLQRLPSRAPVPRRRRLQRSLSIRQLHRSGNHRRRRSIGNGASPRWW